MKRKQNEKKTDNCDFDTGLLYPAMHSFQKSGLWRNRSQSFDHFNLCLRLYARREGGLCDRLLLWPFAGYLFWRYAWVLCPGTLYIGYINGKFSRIFYPEDIKLPLGLIVVSDLTYGLTCYILLFLLRGRFAFAYYFVHVILPEVVYTIVVTLLLYPVILFLNHKLEVKEKRSAQKFV